jgi:hypothetical protein
MRNKVFSKNPLRLLLITGWLLSGGYTLTAQASGVVTDCSTFGPTSTRGVYLPGTLGAALVGGGDITFACSGTITVVPEIRINAEGMLLLALNPPQEKRMTP